jgi:hypothetical protein
MLWDKVRSDEPSPEDILPKGVSITPMYPAIKFQKRDRQSYEILSNTGVSFNFRPNDPAKNIWVFTSAGPIFTGIDSKLKDWTFSWMVVGLTMVDKTSKIGLGIGLSCDIFGHKGEDDIGIFEDERAYFKNLPKNLGLVVTINRFPSQAKTTSSKTWTEIAQGEQNPLKSIEFYSKAIVLNPENNDAQKGIIQAVKNKRDPGVAIGVAKMLFKAGALRPADALLDSAKGFNASSKDSAEIDHLKTRIKNERN